MLIQILIDNPGSWIMDHAGDLVERLKKLGHEVKLIHEHKDVVPGNVLCLLACEKIFKDLELNEYNLVIHESALPKGKGWSPLTWQILEGRKEIPITLFEAAEKVDAGRIYLQDTMQFEGHELLEELKNEQGRKTADLIIRFVEKYPNIKGAEQSGESTFYKRRGPDDSELDIHKTIDEQFNLFRVCDNKRYPAFFIKDGIKYILQIQKDDNENR